MNKNVWQFHAFICYKEACYTICDSCYNSSHHPFNYKELAYFKRSVCDKLNLSVKTYFCDRNSWVYVKILQFESNFDTHFIEICFDLVLSMLQLPLPAPQLQLKIVQNFWLNVYQNWKTFVIMLQCHQHPVVLATEILWKCLHGFFLDYMYHHSSFIWFIVSFLVSIYSLIN